MMVITLMPKQAACNCLQAAYLCAPRVCVNLMTNDLFHTLLIQINMDIEKIRYGGLCNTIIHIMKEQT